MRSLAVCAALAAATSTEGLPAAAPRITGAPAKSAVDTAPKKLRTPPSQHPDPVPTAPQSPPVETQPLTDDEVCVVITGYDTADTVANAVASVLEQTHEHLHIVFVDDDNLLDDFDIASNHKLNYLAPHVYNHQEKDHKDHSNSQISANLCQ